MGVVQHCREQASLRMVCHLGMRVLHDGSWSEVAWSAVGATAGA